MLRIGAVALVSLLLGGNGPAASAANFIVSGDLKFVGGDASVERLDIVALHAGQEIDRLSIARRSPHFVFPISSIYFYQRVCLDVQNGAAVASAPTCIDNPAQVAAAAAPNQFANTVPGQTITITDVNSRIKGDLDAIEDAIGTQDWKGAEERIWASGAIAEKMRETRRFYALWANLIFKARSSNEKLLRTTLEVSEVLRRGDYSPGTREQFEKLSQAERVTLLGQFSDGLENGFDHEAPIDGDNRRIFDATIDLEQWLHDEFDDSGTWITRSARFCSNIKSEACMARLSLRSWLAKLKGGGAPTSAQVTNLAVATTVLANFLWPLALQEGGCCDADLQEMASTFQDACDYLDSVDRSLLARRQYRIVRQLRDQLASA